MVKGTWLTFDPCWGGSSVGQRGKGGAGRVLAWEGFRCIQGHEQVAYAGDLKGQLWAQPGGGPQSTWVSLVCGASACGVGGELGDRALAWRQLWAGVSWAQPPGCPASYTSRPPELHSRDPPLQPDTPPRAQVCPLSLRDWPRGPLSGW